MTFDAGSSSLVLALQIQEQLRAWKTPASAGTPGRTMAFGKVGGGETALLLGVCWASGRPTPVHMSGVSGWHWQSFNGTTPERLHPPSQLVSQHLGNPADLAHRDVIHRKCPFLTFFSGRGPAAISQQEGEQNELKTNIFGCGNQQPASRS